MGAEGEVRDGLMEGYKKVGWEREWDSLVLSPLSPSHTNQRQTGEQQASGW